MFNFKFHNSACSFLRGFMCWFYHILPVRASIVSITHPIHKFLQSLANRIQQSCFQTSNTFPPCLWTQFKWSVEFDDVRWFISQKLWISLIFHSYPPVIKHGNWTWPINLGLTGKFSCQLCVCSIVWLPDWTLWEFIILNPGWLGTNEPWMLERCCGYQPHWLRLEVKA